MKRGNLSPFFINLWERNQKRIMFTGLVEEIGFLKLKQPLGKGFRFTVAAAKVLEGMALGDSVSVDGVCQTVVDFDNHGFTFETVEETVRKTTLGSLQMNTPVNLERALPANARLGGHFVLGHVDCTGTILSVHQLQAGYEVSIQFPAEHARYIVPVGSISVDGISLTVAALSAASMKIAVIPHTWENAALSRKKAGDKVNLEFDILGKYVERLLQFNDRKENLTEAWLREKGF
jgi:riboflavin synthase